MRASNYEDSLFGRLNWVDDAPEEGVYGETTYVGTYCVVTGLRPHGIPGNSSRVSVLYGVGDGTVIDNDENIVAVYDTDDIPSAKGRHNRLVAQAYNMDALDFVYGE